MESEILVESRSSKFFKFEKFPEDGIKFEPKAVVRSCQQMAWAFIYFLKIPTDSATS